MSDLALAYAARSEAFDAHVEDFWNILGAAIEMMEATEQTFSPRPQSASDEPEQRPRQEDQEAASGQLIELVNFLTHEGTELPTLHELGRRYVAWVARHTRTKKEAQAILGISRNTLNKYLSGA